MPVYEYQGKHYDLPDGLTPDQAKAKITSYLGSSTTKPTTTQKEDSPWYSGIMGNSTTKGIGQGINDAFIKASNMGADALDLASAGAMGLVGADSTKEQIFQNMIDRNAYWDKEQATIRAKKDTTLSKAGGMVGSLPAYLNPVLLEGQAIGRANQAYQGAKAEGATNKQAGLQASTEGALTGLMGLIPGLGKTPLKGALAGAVANMGLAGLDQYVTNKVKEYNGLKQNQSMSLEDFLLQGLLGAGMGAAHGTSKAIENIVPKTTPEGAKAAFEQLAATNRKAAALKQQQDLALQAEQNAKLAQENVTKNTNLQDENNQLLLPFDVPEGLTQKDLNLYNEQNPNGDLFGFLNLVNTDTLPRTAQQEKADAFRALLKQKALENQQAEQSRLEAVQTNLQRNVNVSNPENQLPLDLPTALEGNDVNTAGARNPFMQADNSAWMLDENGIPVPRESQGDVANTLADAQTLNREQAGTPDMFTERNILNNQLQPAPMSGERFNPTEVDAPDWELIDNVPNDRFNPTTPFIENNIPEADYPNLNVHQAEHVNPMDVQQQGDLFATGDEFGKSFDMPYNDAEQAAVLQRARNQEVQAEPNNPITTQGELAVTVQKKLGQRMGGKQAGYIDLSSLADMFKKTPKINRLLERVKNVNMPWAEGAGNGDSPRRIPVFFTGSPKQMANILKDKAFSWMVDQTEAANLYGDTFASQLVGGKTWHDVGGMSKSLSESKKAEDIHALYPALSKISYNPTDFKAVIDFMLGRQEGMGADQSNLTQAQQNAVKAFDTFAEKSLFEINRLRNSLGIKMIDGRDYYFPLKGSQPRYYKVIDNTGQGRDQHFDVPPGTDEIVLNHIKENFPAGEFDIIPDYALDGYEGHAKQTNLKRGSFAIDDPKFVQDYGMRHIENYVNTTISYMKRLALEAATKDFKADKEWQERNPEMAKAMQKVMDQGTDRMMTGNLGKAINDATRFMSKALTGGYSKDPTKLANPMAMKQVARSLSTIQNAKVIFNVVNQIIGSSFQFMTGVPHLTAAAMDAGHGNIDSLGITGKSIANAFYEAFNKSDAYKFYTKRAFEGGIIDQTARHDAPRDRSRYGVVNKADKALTAVAEFSEHPQQLQRIITMLSVDNMLRDSVPNIEDRFNIASQVTSNAMVGMRRHEKSAILQSFGDMSPIVSSNTTFANNMMHTYYELTKRVARDQEFAPMALLIVGSQFAAGMAGSAYTSVADYAKDAFDTIMSIRDPSYVGSGSFKDQIQNSPILKQWLSLHLGEDAANFFDRAAKNGLLDAAGNAGQLDMGNLSAALTQDVGLPVALPVEAMRKSLVAGAQGDFGQMAKGFLPSNITNLAEKFIKGDSPKLDKQGMSQGVNYSDNTYIGTKSIKELDQGAANRLLQSYKIERAKAMAGLETSIVKSLQKGEQVDVARVKELFTKYRLTSDEQSALINGAIDKSVKGTLSPTVRGELSNSPDVADKAYRIESNRKQ